MRRDLWPRLILAVIAGMCGTAAIAQPRPVAPPPPVVPSVVQTLPSPAVTGQPVVVGQPFVLPGHPAPLGQPVTLPGQPIQASPPSVVIQSPPLTFGPSMTSPYAPAAMQTPAAPPPVTIPDPAAPAVPTIGRSQTAIKIVEVRSGSAAAAAGFEAGDIILRVDDLRTKTFDNIINALKASTGTSTVEYFRPSTKFRGTKQVAVKDGKIGVVIEQTPILLNDPNVTE